MHSYTAVSVKCVYIMHSYTAVSVKCMYVHHAHTAVSVKCYNLRSRETKPISSEKSHETKKKKDVKEMRNIKSCKAQKRLFVPTEIFNEKKMKTDVKSTEVKSLNVQGHFHQGHLKFGVNTGNQYVANSLCAMIFSRIKGLRRWTSYDMDLILNTGDELYGHLAKSSTVNNDYLLVSELPGEHFVFNKSYTMISESVSGMFEDDGNFSKFNMMQLDRALQQTLQRYNACFICFHQNTFGVIAQIVCIIFLIHIAEILMVAKSRKEEA